MLCCRRISATGTPASPCFRMLTIWLSVKRDFRMGISFAPERLPSNCLPDGEAYDSILLFHLANSREPWNGALRASYDSTQLVHIGICQNELPTHFDTVHDSDPHFL